MTIIDARPAEDIDEARFPGAVDEARGAGHRDDAPEESATDQPAAATEPADEDQALPVEADLAGETAVALTQASSTDAEPGDAPAVAEAAEAVPATNRGDDTGDDTGGDPAGVELTADDPDRILHVDPAEMTCVWPLRATVASGCGVPAGAVGVTGPVELGHVALLSSATDVVGAGEASRGARERPEPYGHAGCLPTPPRRHTDGATDPVGGIRSSIRVVVGTGGHRARRGVPPRRP